MLFQYNTKEKELLSRIMRAEAVGEGNLGMLMVGNVVANRVIANCLDYKNIRTVTEAIYQNHEFSGVDSPLFFSNPTTAELRLAERILRGEYFYPATNALWFYAPGNQTCRSTWYGQQLAGRYKGHCFYQPNPGVCGELH